MHAEVMSIGDELTSGQRLDTNTQWLSQQLGDCGIPVRFHSTVADQMDDLTNAFRIAFQRAPLIIVTGGLGPTADDLTRDAMAQAAGVELELRPEALAQIERLFAQRSRSMPPRNQVQAMFPVGSQIIPNPHGTAPGIDMTVPTARGPSRIFALPGVPAEMKEMWQATVQPSVLGMQQERRLVRHHRVKCFGVGESHLESLLPDLIRRDREPRVGITVHQATITLRITAAGRDEAECRAAIQPTIDVIHQCLGPLVFGEEEDELEDVVVRRLKARQQTVAVCEWASQGLVTQWLDRADGPTNSVLRGGLTVAQRADLVAWLRGDAHTLDQLSDSQLTEWMATQTRQQTGSDWCLAVGPTPASTDESPQLAISVAGPEGTKTLEHNYLAHPDLILARSAKLALDLLRHEIR